MHIFDMLEELWLFCTPGNFRGCGSRTFTGTTSITIGGIDRTRFRGQTQRTIWLSSTYDHRFSGSRTEDFSPGLGIFLPEGIPAQLCSPTTSFPSQQAGNSVCRRYHGEYYHSLLFENTLEWVENFQVHEEHRDDEQMKFITRSKMSQAINQTNILLGLPEGYLDYGNQ